MSTEGEGGDHRFGQHRHRPDDQDGQVSAEHGAGRGRRHRRGVRGAGDGARARRSPPRTRGSRGCRRMACYPEIGIVFDATSAYAHTAHDEALRADGKSGRRPDAGRDRPVHRPAGQHGGQSRRSQRQHGDLRRAGDDPDGRRGQPGREGPLRRDRRLGLLALGRAGHARQYRRVHPHHRARDRGGRRRGQGQGDHHPQPGRAADDHARHGVHAVRGRRRGDDPRLGRGDGAPGCRPTCPATGSSRKCSSSASATTTGCGSPGWASSPASRPSILLEVEGAGDYLPRYSGNLDIMTAAAKATGELLAEQQAREQRRCAS